MSDPLFDDVKALLEKDFGDDRILKQIFRACENNEVISNYERNYVKNLAETHLREKPEITPTSSTVEGKEIISDTVMPDISSTQQTQVFQSQSTRSVPLSLKNSKMLFGIGGGIALAIIVIVAASFSGSSDVSPNITTPISSPDSLSIQTDLSSYHEKDLIAINGTSNISGSVNLSIENQNNELVWTEQISTRDNGKFSTLAIAGGAGWESSGDYTIKVDNGKETISNSFSFTT
jgi:hypothetical protein